jgi:hypothetical protein
LLRHQKKLSTSARNTRHWRNILRAEGIAALRYFKSKQNVALLKPLLNDPTFMVTHSHDDQSDAKRVYYVRKAAYETLTSGVRKSSNP